MISNRRAGLLKLEWLVIVSVVAVCAILAWPNIHFAKININQKKAVSMLATLAAANTFYARDHKSYPDQLDRMVGGEYMKDDTVLSSSTDGLAYKGYRYVYHVDDKNSRFLIFAVPEVYDETGRHSFVVSVKGVVYESDIENVSTEAVMNKHILYDYMKSNKALWKIEDGTYLQIAGQEIKWTKTLVEDDM